MINDFSQTLKLWDQEWREVERGYSLIGRGWDGPCAYRELCRRKVKLLHTVPKGEYSALDYIRRSKCLYEMWVEAQIYLSFRDIVSRNQETKDAQRLLGDCAAKIEAEARRSPWVQGDLESIASVLRSGSERLDDTLQDEIRIRLQSDLRLHLNGYVSELGPRPAKYKNLLLNLLVFHPYPARLTRRVTLMRASKCGWQWSCRFSCGM